MLLINVNYIFLETSITTISTIREVFYKCNVRRRRYRRTTSYRNKRQDACCSLVAFVA